MASALESAHGVVGLVPTMGFFHEGHLSLMRGSVAECDQTVVTLYVNPLQFEDAADLARYPVDHDRDLALAEECGVDLMVIPDPDEMFPTAPLTKVSVTGIADRLEGAHRPGHLDGVATVVARLFAALQPDRAYFGRKDAQQLALVSRLAQDLGFPLEVVGFPLVREQDGLALSSRNVFLGEHRQAALALSHGLFTAATLFEAGECRATVLEATVRDVCRAGEIEYAEAFDAATVEPISRIQGDAVLAVAARVGPVRLIDNVRLVLGDRGPSADRGVFLEQPSVLYDSPLATDLQPQAISHKPPCSSP